MCGGSDTKTASAIPLAVRSGATARSDSSVVRPASSTRIRSSGHAPGDGVGPGDRGLGRVVAGDLATGDDEVVVIAGQVQRDRVVQPGGEHGRRSAVVLGRPEDDDRAGRSPLVALTL